MDSSHLPYIVIVTSNDYSAEWVTFVTYYKKLPFFLDLQSYINFDWGNNFSIDTLLSPRVEPGPKFSESGYLLARVCYIHYVSKVGSTYGFK